MANTYNENKRIIEPLYRRYRNTYRGYRSSEKENLEMGQFLIDVNRLEERIVQTDLESFSKVRILVGALDSEEVDIHSQDSDGKIYIFSDIEVFHDYSGSEEQELEVQTLSTLASRLQRLNQKIKKLERKRL